MAAATLALRRKVRFFDRGQKWQIMIDGMSAGSIADDDAARLPVEPGHHTLRLSSGRFTSPERSFDAADGLVVSVPGWRATMQAVFGEGAALVPRPVAKKVAARPMRAES
jgi:hypothetical protein